MLGCKAISKNHTADFNGRLDLETAPPLVLSPLQAARLLGIGRTTIYQLVKSGELTSIHVGCSVRFSMYEVETYMQSLIKAGWSLHRSVMKALPVPYHSMSRRLPLVGGVGSADEIGHAWDQ